MGYTTQKIRWTNLSFLLVGFAFACGALYCAAYGWPRGVRAGSTVAFTMFGLVALLFGVFPVVWIVSPEKHPVRRELSRYGDFAQVSKRLDAEMAGPVYNHGPFRFTASLLVYDSGHEFQMVPYDRIISAKIEASTDGEPPAMTTIVVHTRDGRRYQWYRTWLQGIFEPERTLARIRAAAKLDNETVQG